MARQYYLDKRVLRSNVTSTTGLSSVLDLNAFVQDVANDAAFSFADGTVSLPGMAFASDTDSGLYRIGSNNIGVAVNGAKVLDVATTGLAITGTVSSTSGATFGELNYKAQVTDTGGAFATPIVLTAAQSGRVILVDDAAGLDFTLPAISASEVGTKFEFLVTTSITSNSFRVTAASGDLLRGGIAMFDFDAAYTAPQGAYYTPDESNDLIMTMNGTTTGGKKGTKITFTAISATGWFVSGIAFGDGVLATPFS